MEVNVACNKHNPNYIRPLDNEVKEVFNPKTNLLHSSGKSKRWLLKAQDGTYIGRISAFINEKYTNKGTDFKVGGIGFFDCTDNQQAADLLFSTAKAWLMANGAEAMDGPINFGDRDKWWGLLAEGFDVPPIYGMAFNPSYYQKLFEGHGFKNYYEQYYYKMEPEAPFPEKIVERHQRLAKKEGYFAMHMDIKELDRFANDFAKVYNAAWAQHEGGKEIAPELVKAQFMKLKPVLDEKLVWFAYYKGDPIAMFVNIPDLNQYFKHFDGKLGLWQQITLLWMRYRGECKKAMGLAFGVVPKYQGLGVDAYISEEVSKFFRGTGLYNEYEMGWSGDWNPRMISIYKSLNATQSRRLITYRYIFDENKYPFERHPVIEYAKR